MKRILLGLFCFSFVLVGVPGGVRPAAAGDDFFGEGLEAFTGLRREDVEEVVDPELDTMRGRFFDFYIAFDTDVLRGSGLGGLEVTGTVSDDRIVGEVSRGSQPISLRRPEDARRGRSLAGVFSVSDPNSRTTFELANNAIADSFNNLSGVVQVTQIAGNNNVVRQVINLNIALFIGGSRIDPNFTAFQNFVRGR